MDSATFWLWTLLFAFLLSFYQKHFVIVLIIAKELMIEPYISFYNRDKEMMPIIKIESTNT